MGILNNDRCNFCHDYIETLGHIFWDCKITTNFWNKLFNWIVSITDTKIKFKKEEVLFHCPLFKELSFNFNFIFLIAKQHIYYCKNKNIHPNLFGFISHLNEIKQMEYFIAYKNNSLAKFNRKWEIIL